MPSIKKPKYPRFFDSSKDYNHIMMARNVDDLGVYLHLDGRDEESKMGGPCVGQAVSMGLEEITRAQAEEKLGRKIPKIPIGKPAVEGCDCLEKIKKKLIEDHGKDADVELSLVPSVSMVTFETSLSLPPLYYTFKKDGKRKRSHVHFTYCPFCRKPQP